MDTANSFADRSYVIELGNKLALDIPLKANQSDSNGEWTRAVYKALEEVGSKHGWKIYPTDKCYTGEYLCDFTLFEDGYGCRIACESQWDHWRNMHQGALDWAFEKLRGVKSDIKVFVFEGSEEQWQSVIKGYLTDFAQLAAGEMFLALRWEKDRFVKSLWAPKVSGTQAMPITFEEF